METTPPLPASSRRPRPDAPPRNELKESVRLTLPPVSVRATPDAPEETNDEPPMTVPVEPGMNAAVEPWT